MRKKIAVDVLLVGPIPSGKNYIGGIGITLQAKLACWKLQVPVALLNTDLFVRKFGSTGKFRLKHFLAFTINFVRLTLAIWRLRPALLHIHSSIRLALLKDAILAFWARWGCRRKVILHIHYSLAEAILLPLPVFWQRLQLHFLMASCDRLVFLSRVVIDELASKLAASGAAHLHTKAVVLKNFTAFTEFPAWCPVLRVPDAPVKIFFIGNIGHRKGAYDLVLAASLIAKHCVKPFSVVFAGIYDSPEDAQRMSALVHKHGLTDCVQFLGRITETEKIAAFRGADIFALPSYGEGVPGAMLEAMASGLPVVVTNVGGIPETVTDGKEGFLFSPGEVEVLAANLVRLIDSAELRLEMGRAARARAQKYHTPQAYFVALGQLYTAAGLRCFCSKKSPDLQHQNSHF